MKNSNINSPIQGYQAEEWRKRTYKEILDSGKEVVGDEVLLTEEESAEPCTITPVTSSTRANCYVFAIRPMNYPTVLLAWQTLPTETFIFKGKEISYENLIQMLDRAEVPEIPAEKPVNQLLVDVKALYADMCYDMARGFGGITWIAKIRATLADIIEKYR